VVSGAWEVFDAHGAGGFDRSADAVDPGRTVARKQPAGLDLGEAIE
jgi:hypothetical protein